MEKIYREAKLLKGGKESIHCKIIMQVLLEWRVGEFLPLPHLTISPSPKSEGSKKVKLSKSEL